MIKFGDKSGGEQVIGVKEAKICARKLFESAITSIADPLMWKIDKTKVTIFGLRIFKLCVLIFCDEGATDLFRAIS